MAKNENPKNDPRHKKPEEDQQLSARASEAIESLCASARLEAAIFVDCAHRLLECSTQSLLNFRLDEATFSEWRAHTVEIREVFESFKNNLKLTQTIQEGFTSNISERAILRLQNAMPYADIAAMVRDLCEQSFELAGRIVTSALTKVYSQLDALQQHTNIEEDEHYAFLYESMGRLELAQEQLPLLQSEARALSRLLIHSEDAAQGLTALDVLAGCSFRRCDVVEPIHEHALCTSVLVNREKIPNITAAVITSITAIEELQQCLFDLCIRSAASPLERICPVSQAKQILCSPEEVSYSQKRKGLAALAHCTFTPNLSVQQQDSVLVTISLPSEAREFRDEIETTLSMLAATTRDTFDLVEIHPSVYLEDDGKSFTAGFKIPLPESQDRGEPHSDTLNIIAGHAEMAQRARELQLSSPLSFDVSTNNRTTAVNISLPGELLCPTDSLNSSPLDRQAGCVANAFSIVENMGEARRLQFIRGNIVSTEDEPSLPAVGMIIISREYYPENVSTIDNISRMAHYIDLWLSDPGIVKELSPPSARDTALTCPAPWLDSAAIVQEVTKLSQLVTFGHVNLGIFPSITQDNFGPTSTASVLRNLREILELESDRLAPFGKPQIFFLNEIMDSDGSYTLPFYLTTDNLGLCATGSLDPRPGQTSLCIFSSSIAQKCSELITEICSATVNEHMPVGPWAVRLQNRLLNAGFGLSERLADMLRQERSVHLERLTPRQVQDTMYPCIARAPGEYRISESFTLPGLRPLSLAILTKNDAALWAEPS